MKKNFFISIRLTVVMIVLCAVIYPVLISLAGRAAPGGGDGETVTRNGRVVGWSNIGQKFSEDRFFWGRPSAVDYNAAGSAGSNKGPSNPDYLKTVHERIDTFLAHNPTVRKEQIPADLVTASGSGLDPDISPASVFIQVARVASARGLSLARVKALAEGQVEKGLLGPDKVNVLKLNLALEALK